MNTTKPGTPQRQHDYELLAAGHDTGWQTNSHNQTEEKAPATASENHNF